MEDLTRCVVTPRISAEGFDSLGVAVHRGSTITFENAEAYANRSKRGPDGYSYGLYGTPTTRTLEQKLTQLEQGARTFLLPSGQAANVFAVLPFLSAGDKILVVDTVYPPMRDFVNNDLQRCGVAVEFYDPSSLANLENRIDGRTKMIWCESPGSTTMEIQDLPTIAEIAQRHGILVGIDNTWATPLNFKPLLKGADIVTEGLTKYIAGHSDVLMGSVTVKAERLIQPIHAALGRYGIGVSPDDTALVLRGMETLGVRMEHSAEGARYLISKLAAHPLVEKVLFPELSNSVGHNIWARDFLGSSGVFSVCFKPNAVPHISAALDSLKVFAIGASWGGTRSLVAPMPVRANRTASSWRGEDLVLRVSVGLESMIDLEADIQSFMTKLSESVAVEA